MSTAKFRQMIECQHCHRETPASDAFNMWVRGHPGLSSSPNGAALVCTDIDWVFHRYMTWENGRKTRGVQCIMFVEVKTHGKTLDATQDDTLHMVRQLMQTSFVHQRERGKLSKGHLHDCRRVTSRMNGLKVDIKCYGVFVLRISGSTPENSQWIEWDGKAITKEQLVKLLKFELDPKNLKPHNPARPHKKYRNCSPGLFEEALKTVGVTISAVGT